MKYQLTGEYECKMDTKCRIRLPSDLLQQLGDETNMFTINRGYEKHLMLYPNEVWEAKTKDINQLNIHNTTQRQVIRYFYRGASKLKIDSSDRLLLPKSLVSYAGLKKELILFAYQEQIEIWSKKNYDIMLSSEPDNFSIIADEVFGSNKANEELKS